MPKVSVWVKISFPYSSDFATVLGRYIISYIIDKMKTLYNTFFRYLLGIFYSDYHELPEIDPNSLSTEFSSFGDGKCGQVWPKTELEGADLMCSN